MMSEKVYDAMVEESAKLGNFAHGHTYAGHPVSAAVALEVLAIYDEMDVVSLVRRQGRVLEDTLHALPSTRWLAMSTSPASWPASNW